MRTLPPFSALAAVVAFPLSGCVNRYPVLSPQAVAATASCKLTVHNNTGVDIEVLESRGGVQTILGIAAPGIHTFIVTGPGDRVVSAGQTFLATGSVDHVVYGARAADGHGWPVWGDHFGAGTSVMFQREC